MTPSSVSDLISAMSSQVRVLFTIFFDWSTPWGSRDRVNKRLSVGLLTNTWYYGIVLPALKDRLKDLSLALVLLLNIYYCPLIGCNPG
jgi:hypothetical protein